MSAVKLSEIDAAQALLDLSVCPNVRGNNQGGEGHNEEVVESAKLFLSCLLTSNNNKTNKTPTPPPTTAAVAAAAVSRIGTVNPIFVYPKTDASEPSEESPASTSTETSKRKSPDHELPRDPRVSAYHEQHTSKRTKLFKGKPIRHYTVVSSPRTETSTKFQIPLNETSSNSKSSLLLDKTKFCDHINTKISKEDQAQASGSEVSKIKAQTRDVGTQTDDLPELPEIETMDLTISKLCDKIKLLEAQINTNSKLMETNYDTSEDDDNDESYKPNTTDMILSERDESVTEEVNTKSRAKNKAGSDRSRVKSTRVLTETQHVQSNTNTTIIRSDMVSIGYGNTMIPARIYRHINWNSYTTATRKLLTAVFSRKILATHSLTGKSSPAFPQKPPKAQLDSTIVDDIVHTVVEKCRVPESVVRTSITTKCADESKMYRTRQENKKKRKPKIDRENIPPYSESD